MLFFPYIYTYILIYIYRCDVHGPHGADADRATVCAAGQPADAYGGGLAGSAGGHLSVQLGAPA